MRTIISNSVSETQKFAANLGLKYQKGGLFTLSGELGSGKTTFVQGLAKTLGLKQSISSPTFNLIKSYPIKGNPNGKLYHIDLYRLNAANASSLGIDEILQNRHNLTVIEWPERLANLSNYSQIKISFATLSKNSRKIIIEKKNIAKAD